MRFQNYDTSEWKEASEWQQALDVGDYYISVHGAYGEIEHEGPIAGVFWVKTYSPSCPDGKTEAFCVVEAERQLTRAEFEQARQNRWK